MKTGCDLSLQRTLQIDRKELRKAKLKNQKNIFEDKPFEKS